MVSSASCVKSLTLELALVGLLVGAFVARAILKRIPAGVHAWLMEAIVVAGAVALLWRVRW